MRNACKNSRCLVSLVIRELKEPYWQIQRRVNHSCAQIIGYKNVNPFDQLRTIGRHSKQQYVSNPKWHRHP